LLVFGPWVLFLLGPQYLHARPAFLMLVLFESIDALGLLNHTLIVGVRRVNHWSLVQVVRIAILVAVFPFFADSYGLMGVAIARGCAWVGAGAVAYWVVFRRLPVRPAVPVQYPLHLALTSVLAFICHLRGDTSGSWVSNVALFGGAVAAFAVCGGYRLSELKDLYARLRGRPPAEGPPVGTLGPMGGGPHGA
jgi:O-antigen/teichoic acid export membrane protein